MQIDSVMKANRFQQIVENVQKRKKRHQAKFVLLVCLLFACAVIAINTGAVQVNMLSWLDNTSENTSFNNMVLWDIRFPRILMTIVTGAGLAICGTVLQAICKNPLADPGLIGVSTSAALFAGSAIALSNAIILPEIFSSYFVPLSAFIGAILALILVIKIADSPLGMNTLVLILAGVAINAGAMALLNIVQYLVDDATLRQITFWSMGSYAGITLNVVLATLVTLICASIYFWRIRNELMLMSCSEKQAKYQGVDTAKLKRLSLLAVAAVVAVCVSFTGIVAFVGLVVPHMCRMFIGSHLRVLIPASMLCGAILVTIADTLARSIITPAELPIGLLTSLVGVPFFLYLILREKKRLSYV